MKHGVYLAGPITGLSYNGATDWRDIAERELESAGIRAISPMRGKKYLAHINSLPCIDEELNKMVLDLSVLSSGKGITTRDRFDATNCDVLLVNLLGAKIVSIGTVMEIAWADLKRTPIVCAIEPSGNVHEHAMVMDVIGFRVPSLEEAIRITKAILL